MFTISDTTYTASSKDFPIVRADSVGGLVPADYLRQVVIDAQYMRTMTEAWYGKMTDKEYAVFMYRGRWQSVFPKFRGKIPNDFKSKA